MSSAETPPMSQGAFEELLARSCHNQIAQEESVLRRVLTFLRDLRATLIAADWPGLKTLLASQDQLARDARAVGDAREFFRRKAGQLLGIHPHEVTIQRAVAGASRANRAELLEARERLLRLAAEAQRLNQSNAVILAHSLDFSRKVLEGLLCVAPGDRYDPSGRRRGGAFGSVVQAKG